MNENIVKFIKLAMDNNELGLGKALLSENIAIPSGGSMATTLYRLFEVNRAKFIRVMRLAGWNKAANNWTTSTATLVEMNNTVQQRNAMRNPGVSMARETVTAETGAKWYNDVLDTMVGGSTSTGTQTTVTEKPASGSQTTMIFVGVGAFAAIGFLIYYLLKR